MASRLQRVMTSTISSITFAMLAVLASTVHATTNQAVTPEGIEWQACPDFNAEITSINGIPGRPFDCAKLNVPLDYTNSTSAPLELSLYRVNATEEPVLGSILINFGGPGEAGGEYLPPNAEGLSSLLGSQWNLVSWDPRGTGKTIPFDCDLGATDSASAGVFRRNEVPFMSPNLTAYYLQSGWKDAQEVVDACLHEQQSTGDLIGTAFVARDVINIADALNEDGLVRYYGTSYGTALGSYIVAMFPDRIDRVILDGNTFPPDWANGRAGNIAADSEKTYQAFLEECFKHKEDCALTKVPNITDPETASRAINAAFSVVVRNATSGASGWSTWGSYSSAVFEPLYTANQWPLLAETLADYLVNGTYNPQIPKIWSQGKDAHIGIRSGDAIVHYHSKEDYLPQVQKQAETGNPFNDNYTPYWYSAQWRMPAKEQYHGDFKVKPRHPVLYVQGEFDPATPLIDARRASQLFEGSVLLQHSGYGHGALSDPSTCVSQHVQRYLSDGTMPQSGTTCQPDHGPWELARLQNTNPTASFIPTATNSSVTTTSAATTLPPVQNGAVDSAQYSFGVMFYALLAFTSVQWTQS